MNNYPELHFLDVEMIAIDLLAMAEAAGSLAEEVVRNCDTAGKMAANQGQLSLGYGPTSGLIWVLAKLAGRVGDLRDLLDEASEGTPAAVPGKGKGKGRAAP